MNRKNLLLVIAALLLVALGNWLTEQSVKQVDKHLTPQPEVQLDYYLNRVTISALDDEGRLQHRLQATQLNHYSTTDQTMLQQPRMEILKQDDVLWRLTAEQGVLEQQNDELLLQGQVELLQPSAEQPLRLNTPALRIQPRDGTADTNQPVTLRQASSRIDAVGMKIEDEGKRVTLLSHVRGHYEPLVP